MEGDVEYERSRRLSLWDPSVEVQGVGESTLESTLPDLDLDDLDLADFDWADPSFPYSLSSLGPQSSSCPKAPWHADADMSDSASTASRVFSSNRTVSTGLDMPSLMDESEQFLHKDRVERGEPEHGAPPWLPNTDKHFQPTRSPENNRFLQMVVRHVARMFLRDPELLTLYKQATLHVDEETFKRNNERLLRRLYADLRSRVTKSRRMRMLVLELLRHHGTRVQISRKVHHAVMDLHFNLGARTAYLDPRSNKWEFRDGLRHADVWDEMTSWPQRKFRLDMMSNTWSFRPPAQDGDPPNATNSLPDIPDDPGDVPSDSDDEGDFPHLLQGEYSFEAAARFMTTGRPFQLYKERLREYLHPVPKPEDAPGETATKVFKSAHEDVHADDEESDESMDVGAIEPSLVGDELEPIPETQSEDRGHQSEGAPPQGETEASAQGPVVEQLDQGK